MNDDLMEFLKECESLSRCVGEAVKLYGRRFSKKDDGMIDPHLTCAVFSYYASKSYDMGNFTEEEMLHDMRVTFRKIQKDKETKK